MMSFWFYLHMVGLYTYILHMVVATEPHIYIYSILRTLILYYITHTVYTLTPCLGYIFARAGGGGGGEGEGKGKGEGGKLWIT